MKTACKLRQRITIQTPTNTLSASGEATKTWTDFKTVSAQISPAAGQETWRAAQVNPLLSHAITIRFVAGLQPKMRVKYVDQKNNRTRYFGIDSLWSVDERAINEMKLMCIEDVDGN